MSQVLQLIEKQMAANNLRSRLGASAPGRGRFVTREGISLGPCLTISRECGSGGSALARMVGERLGWNVFDAKMVDEIAQAAHVHRRLVQGMDEHAHSLWEQTWRDLLMDGLPDRAYLRHLGQIIFALAHQGHVVLVGRGAQHFLPAECALRVRLIAPLEARAQRVGEREHLESKEARALVNRIDNERMLFVWKSFHEDSDAMLNYDLILNTGALSQDAAAEILLGAVQTKFGLRGQGAPPVVIPAVETAPSLVR